MQPASLAQGALGAECTAGSWHGASIPGLAWVGVLHV